jgi:hypothetical protein
MAKRATNNRETSTTDSPTPSAPAKSRRAATTPVSKLLPTREQIEQRAFEIYIRRNGGPGDAASDWLQAERELGAQG